MSDLPVEPRPPSPPHPIVAAPTPPPSPDHLEPSGGQGCLKNDDNPLTMNEGSAAVRAPSERRFVSLIKHYNPSLTLENCGSVARDHLASERTFLAYVRTSLAIASAGVALVQLFTISANATGSATGTIRLYGRPLGATTICLGVVVLLIGTVRYFTVQHALAKGFFPVARIFVACIALSLAIIIVTVFGILASGRR